MRETKTFPLVDFKELDDEAGTFTGRASTFDTIDSYGDTIRRGAYEKTLPDFLKRGFIAWSHDWQNPIAMVTSAEERDDGLHIAAKFHSDPQAQVYRTRVRERIQAGQFMGLSIGYQPVSTHDEDMDGKSVRVLDEIKLYEVSLVTVPAEEHSGLITVKDGTTLTFDDHSDQVEAAVAEWLERCKSGSDVRQKAGRAISEARRVRIQAVSGSLRSAADELDGLIAGRDEDAEDEDPDETATEPVGLSADLDPELKQALELYLYQQAVYGVKET